MHVSDRNTCSTLGLIVLGNILVLPARAHAELADSDDSAADAKSAVECPRLFGGEKARSENKIHREKQLLWTVADRYGITVAHTERDWEDVTKFEVTGIELVSRAGSEPEMIIEISSGVADEVGCPAGRYLLRRDHTLGRDTRILAVFRNAVLITCGDRLGYLAVPDAPAPRWFLAWQLPGVTVYPRFPKPRIPRRTKTKPRRRPQKPRRRRKR